MLAACGSELKEHSRVRKLTLIARHVTSQMPWESDGEEYVTWTCECSCGETVVVEEEKLISGTVYSCKPCRKKKHGNERTEALIKNFDGELKIGTIVGHLELVEEIAGDTKRWKAKCRCGDVSEYSERQLTGKRWKVTKCLTCAAK